MDKTIIIDGKKIGKDCPVYTIAEMSANHLQELNRAKQIIKAAKEAGADAIKLQTYRPDTITVDCRGPEFMATPGSPWEGMNLFELYGTAYTPWEWHKELFDYAKEVGITCFSSPFDLTAVDFLEELGAPAYKIASFEINDIPLIRKAAKTGKPVIISTGIAAKEDIELALQTCKEAGNNQVILLKCVSEYPTPYEELNLKTISDMGETFDCVVGLSDHSMGSVVDVAGVVLGACVVEKHMTLRRADGGPDGSFSMEPEEFSAMIKDIRNIEIAIGEVTYDLTDKQLNSRGRSRSLYVVQDMKKGDVFTADNLKSIRPNYGLHTKFYDDIIGKKATCDILKGTAMKWDYVEGDL